MDRKDGLPHPQTVGETYMAALLDEIRGLRSDLTKYTEPKVGAEPPLLRVKEPEKTESKKPEQANTRRR